MPNEISSNLAVNSEENKDRKLLSKQSFRKQMDFKKGDIVKIQKGDCANLLGCIMLGIRDKLQGNYIVFVEAKATHIVVTHREISLVRGKESSMSTDDQ